jgi:glycolate oxidase FAD binding subunit
VTTTAADTSVTSVQELCDRIRRAGAADNRQPLRISGGGSWLDANRPVAAASLLSTAALTGIVEYVPGDLTLTARAGTTLKEIEHTTSANGQWLTLDPIGDPQRATLGATMATASYGPLAHHFGTPRDLALGVEFVNGSGERIRGGGRVVKNVAGFDLTRLLIGSWGSLGVITEVTVRLRALPERQSTLLIDIRDSADDIDGVRRELRRLPFTPLSAQLLHRTLADLAGLDGVGARLLVRTGGNEEALRAQREQLAVIGEVRDAPDDAWESLRVPERPGSVVVRLSQRPSRFAESWAMASRLVDRWPFAYCQSDPGRGVVRCVLPQPRVEDSAFLDAVQRELSAPMPGKRIFERLPRELWPVLAPSALDELSARIKRTFDPQNILNPGILGDGA